MIRKLQWSHKCVKFQKILSYKATGGSLLAHRNQAQVSDFVHIHSYITLFVTCFLGYDGVWLLSKQCLFKPHAPSLEVKFTKQVNPFLYVIRDSQCFIVDSRWINFVLVLRRRQIWPVGPKVRHCHVVCMEFTMMLNVQEFY